MQVKHKVKLSALHAKLRPQVRRFLVWDTEQRGLALQVEPTGYRSYKLIYRFRGRPRWYTIGAADAIALADARKLAAELMLEVIRGKDPAGDRRAGRQTATFGALATRYLEEHAKKRNKSWRKAAHLINRYVLPLWSDLSASAISRADVRALISQVPGAVQSNGVLASASAICRATIWMRPARQSG
jgi:hypothetical protein